MRVAGVAAEVRQKFKQTTDSGHALPVAESVLDQAFDPAEPNAAWVADVAYVPTREGWLYLGGSCAMVGWRCPEFALSFPAFMLVNAVLFHIAPAAATRVFSPGLFTAAGVFLPVAGWAYYGAWRDGALTALSGSVSGVLGFVMMMFPIALQVTKRREFFRQDGGAGSGGAGR